MNTPTSFTVTLDVQIRPCRQDDLLTLEWFGMFAPNVLLTQFQRQQKGEALILVAEANRVASGQIWLDFSRHQSDSVGVLWAIRVFPTLQGLGIGTRLIRAAEIELAARGFTQAELDVHHENADAQRLYFRLGYMVEAGVPHTPGLHVRLRKPLTTPAHLETSA